MTEQEKASSVGEGMRDRPSHPKRFYNQVAIKDEADGTSVLLDGKPVRTPGKAAFLLPNAALAEAVAEEWRGQGARIDPATMPLTRLANSVIDGVKGHEEAVIGDVLNYAGSDLICYRAEVPSNLVARQTKHWDPVVVWAKQDLGVPMRLAEGVMHVAQPRCVARHAQNAPPAIRLLEPRGAPRHDRHFRLGVACPGGRASPALPGRGMGRRTCR